MGKIIKNKKDLELVTSPTWIYLERKELFDEIKKTIFYSFWRAIIWWKNKNLIKNSEHKLYLKYICSVTATI